MTEGVETSYRLEVAAFDLGQDVKAVGLELIDPETRDPVGGSEAARIWAAVLLSLAGETPWALDFFAHLERVEEFCKSRGIAFRQPNEHVLILLKQLAEPLGTLFERFAGETFGIRAGETVDAGDDDVEGKPGTQGRGRLSHDICELFILRGVRLRERLSNRIKRTIRASEVIRRLRTGLLGMRVEIARPG